MALLALALCCACSGSLAGDDRGIEPAVGDWRGVLLSPGGELPFALRVGAVGSEPAAVVVNAGVETPIASVTRQGAASYTLRFAGRDSLIVAKMSPNGLVLSGYWRYAPGSGTSGAPAGSVDTAAAPAAVIVQMPFSASKDDPRRFQRNDPALRLAVPQAVAAVPTVGGDWEVTLGEGGDARRLRASLRQEGERVDGIAVAVVDAAAVDAAARSSGLPPALEGIYRNGLLRLSLFDGARAWLLQARASAGGEFEGTVWIGVGAGIPWRARR